MKCLWVIGLLTVAVLAGGEVLINSFSNSIILGGNLAHSTSKHSKRLIEIKSFKSLEINIPLELYIRESSVVKVELEAQSDLLDKINVHLEGDELLVDANENLIATQPIVLKMEIPHLRELKLKSVATVFVDKYCEKSLYLEVDGVVELHWSGGSIDDLFLKADGSYTLRFLDLLIKKAEVIAEGSGEIVLENVKSLNVNLSDTVTMRYGGHPKIIKKELDDLAELIKI